MKKYQVYGFKLGFLGAAVLAGVVSGSSQPALAEGGSCQVLSPTRLSATLEEADEAFRELTDSTLINLSFVLNARNEAAITAPVTSAQVNPALRRHRPSLMRLRTDDPAELILLRAPQQAGENQQPAAAAQNVGAAQAAQATQQQEPTFAERIRPYRETIRDFSRRNRTFTFSFGEQNRTRGVYAGRAEIVRLRREAKSLRAHLPTRGFNESIHQASAAARNQIDAFLHASGRAMAHYDCVTSRALARQRAQAEAARQRAAARSRSTGENHQAAGGVCSDDSGHAVCERPAPAVATVSAPRPENIVVCDEAQGVCRSEYGFTPASGGAH